MRFADALVVERGMAQEVDRRMPGQRLELADQVRLVVVAAVLRQCVPLRRVALAQPRQHMREAQHPRQRLRGQPGLALEQLCQVLAAVAEFHGQRYVCGYQEVDLAEGAAYLSTRPDTRDEQLDALWAALQAAWRFEIDISAVLNSLDTLR